MVIADSYFGSVNTALTLKWHSLYCVANVKTGHYAFPSKFLKEHCTKRGDACFLKKTWPLVPARQAEEAPEGTTTVVVYASGHCDKKPTNLVATRGKSTPGAPAYSFFHKWVDGDIVTNQYTILQP